MTTLFIPRCFVFFVMTMLCVGGAAAMAEEPKFKVTVDFSAAPECEAFAKRAKELCEEWYPKINEILFGPERPLPTSEVRLEFVPMKGIAHASRGRIKISSEWVTRKAPNDFGMVIHELTHIVQNYEGKGDFWLTEGIADWIRDYHFEPGARKHRIKPDKSRYTDGYGTSARFLAWLEGKSGPGFVRKLNVASKEGSYRPELFSDLCGKNLDDLWQEFVAASAE